MSSFADTPVMRVDSMESIESVDFLVESLEKAQLSGGDDRVQVSEQRMKEKNGTLLRNRCSLKISSASFSSLLSTKM